MGRPTRRPLYSIVVLLCVTCAIYFVATGDKRSLGQGGPLDAFDLNIKTDNLSLDNLDLKADQLPVSSKYTEDLLTEKAKALGESETDTENEVISGSDDDGFTETPFMPKMANETLKAQLGNSAWHLFHTVLARYPDKPTVQEKKTLKQYIHLFAQVYPCGDCARHFQKLLQKYPVQVETRKTAALWGCHIHNKVNERLQKPEYDCTTILEDYDCGCGSDEKEEDSTLGNESAEHLRKVTIDEKADSRVGG